MVLCIAIEAGSGSEAMDHVLAAGVRKTYIEEVKLINCASDTVCEEQ